MEAQSKRGRGDDFLRRSIREFESEFNPKCFFAYLTTMELMPFKYTHER